MPDEAEIELRAAIEKVLQSTSRKKLIVAGPGTGKTTLFRLLLESAQGTRENRLVLTFINNLKEDLESSLSDLSKVFTLHGYCQSLLYRYPDLRSGLSSSFRCIPGLASLIKADWKYLRGSEAPQFVEAMRNLAEGAEFDFYITRGNYYDAVDFDDSVFRIYTRLKASPEMVGKYELVLIDEYQDFNRMEATLIDIIAERNPIVIAGDDDQALYSQLRDSSWEFIRSLYRGDEFERFDLPFCMRCPKVIVDAVNDVITEARDLKNLQGRIEKPYKHFAPAKGEDSKRYPKIALIETSVQRENANYFGRYIAQAILKIPTEEVAEAATKGDPAVLIIASNPYRRQIIEHLEKSGITVDTKREATKGIDRSVGLAILKENPKSNLGWRIILEFENSKITANIVRKAAQRSSFLIEVIPEDLRDRVLEEAMRWEPATPVPVTVPDEMNASGRPSVKVTSFEGAKGLSSQHVFIAGLHEGELPKDAKYVQDIEICRFLVGLTRTRKKCHLLFTLRFADKSRKPSPFLSWINPERYEYIIVNADYWKGAKA